MARLGRRFPYPKTLLRGLATLAAGIAFTASGNHGQTGSATMTVGLPVAAAVNSTTDEYFSGQGGGFANLAGWMKDLARAKHMEFGLMTYGGDLAKDVLLLRREASCVGSTHDWKMISLCPVALGSYVTTENDAIVAEAQANGQKVKAHAIVYGTDNASANPAWWDAFLDANVGAKATVQTALQQYIADIGARFPNQLDYIDVLNEVFDTTSGKAGGYLDCRMYRAYGDGTYLEDSMRAARLAFPTAKLLLTQGMYRYSGPSDTANRANILAWLVMAKAGGYAPDAVGLQGHTQPDANGILDEPDVKQWIRDIQALGIDVHWTELDVEDHDLASYPLEVRDYIIANKFQRVLNCCAENGVKVLIIWGTSARHNAYNTNHTRSDGSHQRGLLLDEIGQPQLAYGRFQDFFLTTPNRTTFGGGRVWGPNLDLIVAMSHKRSTQPASPQLWRGAGSTPPVLFLASGTQGEFGGSAVPTEGLPFTASKAQGQAGTATLALDLPLAAAGIEGETGGTGSLLASGLLALGTQGEGGAAALLIGIPLAGQSTATETGSPALPISWPLTLIILEGELGGSAVLTAPPPRQAPFRLVGLRVSVATLVDLTFQRQT